MKINKKFLVVMAVGILALAVVNAGLLAYYGQVNANIEVTQPITVVGTLEYTLENVMAGDTIYGEGSVTIKNDADFPVEVFVSNNAPLGVNVIYDYAVCTHNACPARKIFNPMNTTLIVPAKSDSWSGLILLGISYELDSMLESGDYSVITTISDTRMPIIPYIP